MNQNRKARLSTAYRMMLVAIGTSMGSTCCRRAVGCVLVDENLVVKSTGYNGSPNGIGHCIDSECLTANNHCINCIHAELNACLQCEGNAYIAYCTDQPCLTCLRALMRKGVKHIIYWRDYNDEERDIFIEFHKISGIISMKKVEKGEFSELCEDYYRLLEAFL